MIVSWFDLVDKQDWFVPLGCEAALKCTMHTWHSLKQNTLFSDKMNEGLIILIIV